MAQEYSLLREPWIPVLMGNGQARRVGILEAFSEAHHIRHVAASNPMDRVAILRFLLALLYWCKGHPESDADLSFREPFPPAWFAKIKENACRFNMLGDGNRFYQNPACHTAKLEHTTDYLIHEVPTGNNFWHFRHATDGVEGLCPACCAMGLVRLPVFTHLGGRGTSSATYKFVGVNATPPLYAVPVGRTLSETLRLSWRRTDWPLGTPEWETPNLRLPREGDVPLLTGLTWVPRSVWLGDPEGAERPCVLCGRQQTLIRVCFFDGKGSESGDKRVWHDPHVVYTPDSPPKPVLASDLTAPGKFSMDRPWGKTLSCLIQNAGCMLADGPRLLLVGFAVDKGKRIDVWERVVDFPRRLADLGPEVPNIDLWREEGAFLRGKLRPASERKSGRKHLEIPSTLCAIRPNVESRVSGNVAALLSGGAAAWENAAREYRPMMEAVARSLAPGFTSAAVRRREQIARAAPDMRPKTGTDQKGIRKKGGGR